MFSETPREIATLYHIKGGRLSLSGFGVPMRTRLYRTGHSPLTLNSNSEYLVERNVRFMAQKNNLQQFTSNF